jgi:hypothetical protein
VNETDWRRVRDLFEAGLEQKPEDADRWLRDRCPDDASVRREVGSLLAEHARAGEFLTRPLGTSPSCSKKLVTQPKSTPNQHSCRGA